jgi:periplasmic protein CpxP/Spy
MWFMAALVFLSRNLLGQARLFEADPREVPSMRTQSFTFTWVVLLILGVAAPAMAQDSGGQQPTARQQLQQLHTPQSIDQELARLTKDLELTPDQQPQVRRLLQEHHDKIQAVLDKNPKATRQDLAPQIHAISDETHREIHALLTEHQQELEKAMQQREHDGEENRRPAPSPPSAPPPDPSLSII